MGKIAFTAALGLFLGLVLFSFPEIDLFASKQLYSAATGFVLKGYPLTRTVEHAIQAVGYAVGVSLITGLVLTLVFRRRVFGLKSRHYAYLILCFALGPVLITSALKEEWHRPRPEDVTQFGGTQTFTPAFVMSDRCPHNCSFVSGDASLAFAFTSLAFLAGRRRRVYVGTALGAGALVGAVRMAEGAHFLSDVVFAGVLMVLVALTLHWLVLERGGKALRSRSAAGPPRPGHRDSPRP